jgi:hypothetical protein
MSNLEYFKYTQKLLQTIQHAKPTVGKRIRLSQIILHSPTTLVHLVVLHKNALTRAQRSPNEHLPYIKIKYKTLYKPTYVL